MNLTNKEKIKEVLMHISLWLLYLLLSSGMMISIYNGVVPDIDDFLILSSAKIFLVYSFYFILFPHFWDKKEIVKGIFILITIIIVFYLILYLRLWVTKIRFPNYQTPEYNKHLLSFLLTYIHHIITFGSLGTLYWFYKHTQKQSQEKLALEQRNHEIEVSFLKSQINQHFVYNMLNMFYVNAIKYSDTLAGGILSLSELMRFSVSHEQKSLIAVSEEIKYVESYIHLNQLRFEEKLLINFKSEGDLSTYRIPHLCILTLVENAFKHGNLKLAPLDILIKAENNTLYVSLKNMKHTAKITNSTGIGLENLKRRLYLLLENRFTLETSADETFFYTVLTVEKL